MLLTLTCTGPHAPDLGYLLHKHPAAVFERDLSRGRLTVFYPENGPDRATVAMLLELDPVALVRGGERAASLDQYVNDRPYVASSFTSVALKEAFGTALAGRSKDRPELVEKPLPLSARVPAVHVAGGPEVARKIFEPLGYTVRATARPLDVRLSGDDLGPIVDLEIAGEKTVRDLLTHLYVLLPVLDNEKHYFVGDEEVEKLLAHGEGWLAAHPEKPLIVARFLSYQRALVRDALSQLTLGQDEDDEVAQEREDRLEERANLHEQRLSAVLAALRGATRVVDMGCGEGKLLRLLLDERSFTEVIGVDVSTPALGRAERRLQLDRKPAAVRERLKLLQGSLVYADARLAGFDAIALVEVIEHIEPERLDVVRRVLFEHLRPRRVVLTTPNSEYNVRFESLPAGRMRHGDHRFEWTRAELRAWAAGAAPLGYDARFIDVGPLDPEVGAPTQMAIFERREISS